jgi:UDP-glucose 4-epimerase
VVVKSSSLVYGSSREDPAFFREDTSRSHPPTNRLERSLIEVESYVQDFALDHPEKAVSILRYSNVLGPNITTSLTRALELPAVPCIAGFDPRWHLVHEDDVVRSLRFAMDRRLEGVYNVAGDGLLPWSEIVALAGKRRWHLPWLGIEATAQALRSAGIVNLTPDLLGLLRYGRGLDTLKLKGAGFSFRYDTAATVADHVGALRLRHTVGSPTPAYRYEEEVEEFLRRSTAVVREPTLVE